MCKRLDPEVRKAREVARNKVYRLAHKKERKLYYKTYRANHGEKIAVYRAAHREEALIYNKTYYIAHLKETQARLKLYRSTHRNEIKHFNLMHKYKISLAEFDVLLDKQGGVCAVCGRPNWNDHGPHVDHNHATGKIRGILCGSCNSGLGFFGDSIDTFKRAIVYLEDKNNEKAFERKE